LSTPTLPADKLADRPAFPSLGAEPDGAGLTVRQLAELLLTGAVAAHHVNPASVPAALAGCVDKGQALAAELLKRWEQAEADARRKLARHQARQVMLGAMNGEGPPRDECFRQLLREFLAAQNPYDPGDQVVCIDARGFPTALTVGRVYAVRKVQGDRVVLEGQLQPWEWWRFRPALEAQAAPAAEKGGAP
jgi:hypothetical protein